MAQPSHSDAGLESSFNGIQITAIIALYPTWQRHTYIIEMIQPIKDINILTAILRIHI